MFQFSAREPILFWELHCKGMALTGERALIWDGELIEMCKTRSPLFQGILPSYENVTGRDTWKTSSSYNAGKAI